MSEKTPGKSNGAMKKGTAYWQTSWMTKVLSNGYNPQAKLIFMRIASFGERGCWMNNETLCEEFNRSDRTIRRAITALWTKGDVIVTGWDGHGRKIYAAGHPKVKPALNAIYGKALKDGKVNDRQEYNSKIRRRMTEAEQVVVSRVKTVKKPVKEKKGLEYYRSEKYKNAIDGELKPEE